MMIAAYNKNWGRRNGFFGIEQRAKPLRSPALLEIQIKPSLFPELY